MKVNESSWRAHRRWQERRRATLCSTPDLERGSIVTVSAIETPTIPTNRLKLAAAILVALFAVALPLLTADPNFHDDVVTQIVGP
jgi:hypothetical protein